MKKSSLRILLASVLAGAGLSIPQTTYAHCDTMDGPVVLAAKVALEKKDVKPVLKWVQREAEAEIQAAFAKTLAVRNKGPEARELADQYFFETLVRVHRAGEGAPFTGVKPAGTDLGPAIKGSDQALADHHIEPVIKLITSEVAAGIRQRFAQVSEKKKHAEESVEAGREFVAAYVEYMHYSEGLHQAAQTATPHHGKACEVAPVEETQPAPTAHHHH